jgi:hypothetical protein
MALQLLCTKGIHSSVRATVPCRLDERHAYTLELLPRYMSVRQGTRCINFHRLFPDCRDGIVGRFFVVQLRVLWVYPYSRVGVLGRFARPALQTFPPGEVVVVVVEVEIASVAQQLDNFEMTGQVDSIVDSIADFEQLCFDHVLVALAE